MKEIGAPPFWCFKKFCHFRSSGIYINGTLIMSYKSNAFLVIVIEILAMFTF